jgi:hypothetical protein
LVQFDRPPSTEQLMLARVPQKSDSDCVTATIATVMGPPYTYERVRRARERYPQITSDGLHASWWETYLWDERFPNEFHPVSRLQAIVGPPANSVGFVMLRPATGAQGHLIAVDEFGCINSATNWPERIPTLHELLDEYSRLGCRYIPEQEFLAVWPQQSR